MSATVDPTTTLNGDTSDKRSKDNTMNTANPQMPLDTWIDKTTTRLLDASPTGIPLGTLTIEDVQLLTTLMHSHAKRATVASAIICERLLKRVVDEVK